MRIFICCVLITVCLATTSFAQNVGIGTTDPQNRLQIQGNFLVAEPTNTTLTAPTGAQTKTMVNASTITFAFGDSTGRIYDPGGPAGNYVANLTANASIPGVSYSPGYELTIESIHLSSGDSLIIKPGVGSSILLLAIGNNYTTPGKWILNSTTLHIIFKSNADANVGSGFSLLFRRLYSITTQPEVTGFAGNALFFDTQVGILRAGQVNSSVKGYFSTALGNNNTASGDFSFAAGSDVKASGLYSTALGFGSHAEGTYSVAMGNSNFAGGYSSTAIGAGVFARGTYSTAVGYSSEANGDYSTVLGRNTRADGDYSTAMGFSTIANGHYSTALGNHVSTNNFEGSFVIGDNSTGTDMNSVNANNFRARFAGGYKLFTSANLSTGCTLFAGDNAWTTGSDVRTKENFAEVNGEDFLKKIAGFHLTSWNYKTQDPKTFRHYGPMAQDFYAAFGKDKYGTIGNDTTINSADFAGVSFIAIQALEKRTAEQKKEIDALKALILQLQSQLKAVEEKQDKKLYATFK